MKTNKQEYHFNNRKAFVSKVSCFIAKCLVIRIAFWICHSHSSSESLENWQFILNKKVLLLLMLYFPNNNKSLAYNLSANF